MACFIQSFVMLAFNDDGMYDANDDEGLYIKENFTSCLNPCIMARIQQQQAFFFKTLLFH
jgi:hypothetical protein